MGRGGLTPTPGVVEKRNSCPLPPPQNPRAASSKALHNPPAPTPAPRIANSPAASAIPGNTSRPADEATCSYRGYTEPEIPSPSPCRVHPPARTSTGCPPASTGSGKQQPSLPG